MLSLEDCVALSCLTEEEIAAIAEHEHLPMVVAAELGSYLVQTPDGSRHIRNMIKDDIKAANARGDLLHALALKLVLRHYLSTHPECAEIASSLPSKGEEVIRRVLSRMPPRCA
ncbi:MAG TPA: hypothetical protein VG742_03555 [Dongiaceae bacterium]|nr:hypothetical protein [Dongiaceae bacterium]